MQFLIHGADHKTGREMTVVVDARDRAEAEQRVLYNDILVSSISHFVEEAAAPLEVKARDTDGEELDYKTPEARPQQREPNSRPSFYRPLLNSARSLRSLSVAISVVGLILVVAALVAVALPWCKALRIYMPFVVVPALCYAAAGAMALMGIVCACCAAPLSMMSEMALAMRDLVRNSFCEEAAERSHEPRCDSFAGLMALRGSTTQLLDPHRQVRHLPTS